MLRSRKSRREEPLDVHVPDADRQPARPASTPSTRRCWPTRSAWRCSWCSRRWRPPSGSPSSCTTCSPCPSTRSPRSWAARRPRPASSRAAPAAGCRARRRRPTPTSTASATVVDAFLAASRDGDFDALVAVLDPDVVLRADTGALRARASREVRGAEAVAAQALLFRRIVAIRAAGARERRGRGRHDRGRQAVLRPGLHRQRRARSSRSTSSPTPSACAQLDLAVLDD